VGLQSASKKKSRGSQLHALKAQLENEKQESTVLREQLQNLREQAEQSEKDRAKQAEEIESLKNRRRQLRKQTPFFVGCSTSAAVNPNFYDILYGVLFCLVYRGE
jgi:hypothetical protein